jgi:uncharacterized membrane protein YbhN (UPF0104 family)
MPTVALAIVIFYLMDTFDAEALRNAFSQPDWPKLAVISVPLILMLIAIRTARWCWLLAVHKAHNVSIIKLYLAIAISIGLGAVTPAQAGEAYKLFLARRDFGVSLSEAAGLHLLERLSDIFVLSSLSVVAFILSFGQGPWILGALGGIALTLVGSLVALHDRQSGWLPKSVRAGLGAVSGALKDRVRMAGFFVLTVVAWALTVTLWGVAFHFVGAPDLPLASLVAIVGVVTFASILSLVPGGLGASEATAAAMLIANGAVPEVALAGALALRLIGITTAALGGMSWLVSRLSPSLR